jgi:amidase
MFKEYDQYDGLGLSELIKRKEVSTNDVLEAAINKAEENKDLNAIIRPMYDEARNEMSKLNGEGIFEGVPTLLKDLIIHYKGVPTTSGSKALKDFIPTEDSYFTQRMKNAGMLIIGKSNTPEFGIKGTTEPEYFGATKNPWDKTRTPGGSSGGSASAVAAGIVPFAHGNDGGGSIRIPASHCGLFGLKPTRKRTPHGPFYGEIVDGAVCDHFITKSVRDSAALLDVVSGDDPTAVFNIESYKGSYLKDINEPPKKLKIGYHLNSPIGGTISSDCQKALEQTITLCRELGHEVQEASPKFDGLELAKYFLIQYSASNSFTYEQIVRQKGASFARNNTELETQVLCLIGKTFTAEDYVRAQDFKFRLCKSFHEFHKDYDLLLTPTVAHPAGKLGTHQISFLEEIASQIVLKLKAGKLLMATGLVDKIAKENMNKVPYTQMTNINGFPSMSVPLYWTEKGMPLGSMFSARFGDEVTLLQLAAQLENAQDWKKRRPNL